MGMTVWASTISDWSEGLQFQLLKRSSNLKLCRMDEDVIDHGLDGYGIEDVIDGEGELRYEMQWGRS
jgi:hypothetical protein